MSLPPRLLLVTLVWAIAGCVSGGSAEADAPIVKTDFPPVVEAGKQAAATVTVQNPSSRPLHDMEIAFSLVGRVPDTSPLPVGSSVPHPIVAAGARGATSSVLSVDPKPVAVSQDGLVYRFPTLSPGETTTIHFILRMPVENGVAANAVIVSDGTDAARAHGVTLETTVKG